MARLRSWNRSIDDFVDAHPVAGVFVALGIAVAAAFAVGSALGVENWWPAGLVPAVGAAVGTVAGHRWRRSRDRERGRLSR